MNLQEQHTKYQEELLWFPESFLKIITWTMAQEIDDCIQLLHSCTQPNTVSCDCSFSTWCHCPHVHMFDKAFSYGTRDQLPLLSPP
jgi:hypothetical protein